MRLTPRLPHLAKSGLVGAWLLFASASLFGGCMHAPPLPSDLSQAEQKERATDESAALAEYDAIVQGCRKSPRSEPKDPCGTAALRRAQTLEHLNRPDEAAAAYLEVRMLSSDGRTIARALLRAAALFADPLGKIDVALRLCREIIPRWPDEVAAEDALRLLVEIQTAAADPALADELGRLSDTLAGHEVIGSFALYYRGKLAEKRQQPDLALASYDAIWQRFPHGPLFDDALMGAAKLLRQRGHSAEAAQRLERLEASFQKAIIIGHYNTLLLDDGAILLGEIYLRDLMQPERAIAVLSGFLKRQRTSLLCDDALLLMAEAALRKHTPPVSADKAEACRYLKQLRHDYPDGNRVRSAGELQTRIGCLSRS